MAYTFVELVLSRGALLSISRTAGVNTMLEATLLFPWCVNQDPFEATGVELIDILSDLNSQLAEDAAQEMINAGGA
jgi:hypothetical protein